MSDGIDGLHHVTAMSAHAARTHAFYTTVLGLRLVKKTVNFDDPSTYHLYYGNEQGTPGSVLTVFPFAGIGRGRRGIGEVARTHFAVPKGSLGFWRERLQAAVAGGIVESIVLDRHHLVFEDPDGLPLALVEVEGDERTPSAQADVPAEVAIRGFHGLALCLGDAAATSELLCGLLDYCEVAREGARHRLMSTRTDAAAVIDIIVDKEHRPASPGAGSVHHIAFSVKDRAMQERLRQKIRAAGHMTTPVIDRGYFHSVYFRSPGGVLFEIATEEPGFTVDEPLSDLGRSLKLPERYEVRREAIERQLPSLEA